MSDTIVIESDDEFTVIELTEQGPAGPSGSSVPSTPTTLGGIIASGHFWIAANGTLYLANQTSTGAYGNATHVSHIEVDTQGRVIAANPVLITPDWSSIQNRPSFANVAISGLYSDLTGLPNLSVYQLTSTNTWANLTGRPNLAAVATSGLYSDLTGTPNLSLYLTVANALATYQTIAGMSSYATLASPALTGTPTAPTAANGTATTQLATTAFVANALASYVTTANFTFANLGSKPTTLAGYGITDGLTSSTAASTYAPISTTVTLTGTQTLTNKTLFGTSLTGTTSIGGTTDLSGNLLQRAGVLPIVVSSASYTLQQSDCGGLIVLTGTAAQTITIPTGLSRGFNVSIFQKSAFSSTIAAGSGVTLYAKNGAKTSGQNALVGIVDVGDANPPTGFSIGGDTTT